MHRSPRKRVQKQMPAFARFQHFGQQAVRRGQRRPALLNLQQRPHALQLGRVVTAFFGQGQLLHHRRGQRRRERHAPAVPARHRRALAAGAAHPGRHLVDANQFKQPAAKQKAVSGLQTRGKAFFDRADLGAADILHRHAGVTDDGADIRAVTPRQPRIGHAPHARFVRHGTAVVGIDRQRGSALRDEGQAPVPVFLRQLRVGRRAAHLGQQFGGHKATAQRNRDQVLHQHIEWLRGRCARLNMPGGNRRAGGSALDHLQAVRGHQRDARGPAGRMARTPGALQQPRHAFGRADLQHALNR